MTPVLLAEALRGGLVESRHVGSLAVCDASGRLLAWAGDPGTRTYWRSCMKPVQAIPLILSGALDAFGLGDEALALACASHAGEPVHLEVADRMLAAGGFSEKDLSCGAPSRRDQRSSDCSGKHAGMLLTCRHKGWPTSGYLDPAHPLQEWIRRLVSSMTSVPESDLTPAVDGCSAPVYALTLDRMATAYARLVRPPMGLEAACRRVASAMSTHPLMVHGTGGFDTDLMRTVAGRMVSKRGAEGVACLALAGPGWGLALKVADGNPRAAAPAVLRALEQLGLLTPDEREALAAHARPSVRSVKGAVVGEVRPGEFVLEKGGTS